MSRKKLAVNKGEWRMIFLNLILSSASFDRPAAIICWRQRISFSSTMDPRTSLKGKHISLGPEDDDDTRCSGSLQRAAASCGFSEKLFERGQSKKPEDKKKKCSTTHIVSRSVFWGMCPPPTRTTTTTQRQRVSIKHGCSLLIFNSSVLEN